MVAQPSLFVRFAFAALALAISALPARSQDFDSLLDSYLAGYWKANPSRAATRAGVHTYDSKLEDLSAQAVTAEIQRTRSFLAQFEALRGSLPPARRPELALVEDHLRLALAELEEARVWKTNPLFYVDLARDSVLLLAKREFAPGSQRFEAVAARLKLIPLLLVQARANLDNPAALHTRRAIAAAAEAASLFENYVPQAAAEQGASRKLLGRVSKESSRSAAAMQGFRQWLEADLLPRSKGSPALGAEDYARRLRWLTGDDRPIDGLLKDAEDGAAAARSSLLRAAADVAPAKSPRDVLLELAAAQADPLRLTGAVRDAAVEARRFVEQRRLLTPPQPDRLRVGPAPPGIPDGRPVLELPGPFEPDLPALYYVPAASTPVSLDGNGDHLSWVNAHALAVLVSRNTYPGRYVQADAANRVPFLARKVFGNRAFIDGWARYAERIMFEEGFREDPRSRVFHAKSELDLYLLAVVDVALHTGSLQPAEAVKKLVEQGFESQAEAEAAVDRALLDPGRLAAAFSGFHSILMLREEMKKKLGPAFVTREFHDRLLALGAPRLADARTILLSE